MPVERNALGMGLTEFIFKLALFSGKLLFFGLLLLGRERFLGCKAWKTSAESLNPLLSLFPLLRKVHSDRQRGRGDGNIGQQCRSNLVTSASGPFGSLLDRTTNHPSN